MAKHYPVPRGVMAVRAEGAAPTNAEVKALVEGVQAAFAQFKAEHTKQLEEVKAGRSGADQEAKLEKINSALSGLQKEVEDAHTKIAAGQMGGPGAALRDKEYTDSFNAHMRKGDVQAALNKGVAEEGGFLTPVEWDRTITDRLRDESPMRELAQVQPTSKAGWSKLFNMGGTGSGWVGETDARPETATPVLASLGFGHGEIYANPAATQQLLDDSEINIEAWLAAEVQAEFAEQEGAAFISGDGVKKPAGILTYVTGGANAAKHPFGAIQAINSGAATDISSDAVLDLIYGLPKKYRQNARFLTNNLTIAKLRKLKDGQGNYLWQPSAQAGQPATLHGYGLAEDENMPDVAANAIPVLFGDYKRGYLIIDRMGVRVLRDPYTKKPYVLFYTTKRVGGGVQNPECLRALKVAA
ncbi:phage major capsid protein [Comamonas sp. C11]|uniref:phage major capsid protein n=1 Tax=Comamonas sp. C11 TaxID=2966554 RepID=UPI002111E80C|nr:phage major capsid protein [Comamonas sp. C11]UUC92468.1 phage major capsid protein [Comamonas sp. C11]UUC92520.1 phage major capsid protein [Comamonas sp. C11]